MSGEQESRVPASTADPEGCLRAIRVVLVRPRGAANVGAVARAMRNTGLSELIMVGPVVQHRFLARGMAVHARDLLDRARTVDSLADAIGDCSLVVGTTCRGGLYRSFTETPEAIAGEIVSRAARGPVAIVFGQEDHGLTNDDLRFCQRLIAIPTAPEYPSLNLAQAVLVICYELRRVAFGGRFERPPRDLAPAADVEFALARLQESFLRIGFLKAENPDHIMFALRRIFGRAGLEPRDVRILLGLARQIEWYAREGWRHHDKKGSNG